MSDDGNSQLDALRDAAASAILNAYDAYGWIVPALLLSVLFLGMLGLFVWWFEDLPFEFLDGCGGILRWTRSAWRGKGRGVMD
jgi:hypothetical protein